MKYLYIFTQDRYISMSITLVFEHHLCPQLCIYVFDLSRTNIPNSSSSAVCAPYTLFLGMTSVSAYIFASHLLYKNRAGYYTNDYRFAHYYFIMSFIHVYIHTHMNIHICTLSVHLYIMTSWVYFHTHVYVYIVTKHFMPRSPCPAAFSPPSTVRSLTHVRRQFSLLSSPFFLWNI